MDYFFVGLATILFGIISIVSFLEVTEKDLFEDNWRRFIVVVISIISFLTFGVYFIYNHFNH